MVKRNNCVVNYGVAIVQHFLDFLGVYRVMFITIGCFFKALKHHKCFFVTLTINRSEQLEKKREEKKWVNEYKNSNLIVF